MLLRILLGILAGCVLSMCYFPFEFTFLPGVNTKMMLAVVGIVVCAVKCARDKKVDAPRPLFHLVALAAAVSIVALATVTYNHTPEVAYVDYVVSMLVWLSAAFVSCVFIKKVEGRLDLITIGKYLTWVCVAQCIIALMIDGMPPVAAFVDRFVQQGQGTLKSMHRLYGIGCNLDVAGTRFSCVLVILVATLHNQKEDMGIVPMTFYLLAFLIIAAVGSIIARTTYVGIILSAVYVLLNHEDWSLTVKKSTFKVAGIFVIVLAAVVAFGVFKYNTDDQYYSLIRFGFEGFFNLFENGEYTVSSNETLKSMYVWPDNMKTWIIGDGYFSNPRGDINYTGNSTNKGFYMGTDVGYCRFIFFFGIIGIALFSWFFIKTTMICADLLPEYRLLMFFILIANFVIWFKVATDVFPVISLIFCVSLMCSPDEEEEEEPDS